MLRAILRIINVSDGVHVKDAPADIRYETRDFESPEIEAALMPENSWERAVVIGVESLVKQR